MNKIFTTLLLLLGLCATAQVKIGDNPNTIGSSSILELESTNKAFVLTRVANTGTIVNPVNGMMVYDLSSNCIKFYENGVWSSCISTVTNALTDNILAQIGFEADDPGTISTVTPLQLTQIGITGVVGTNEDAYQHYIDSNPNEFSNPATVTEVQDMVTTVNTMVNGVLAQIGAEGDNPDNINCTIDTSQLEDIGITGVTPGNEIAYQEYIDSHPDEFSNPATISEVQEMVTSVNNNVTSVLAQIGAEGDSPDSVNSIVTTEQIQSLGVTGVNPDYENAYEEYIDTYPNQFSNPATIAEVQAMVTAVNNSVEAILAQIGNEGDNPDTTNSIVTTTQLISIGISGVNPVYEIAYQDYIDTYPDTFSNPATIGEVQAMVTAVNNSAVTSGGTGVVSNYTCNTASAGTLTQNQTVSGVTQTITAMVVTVGTYHITAIANGVSFTADGTFAGTGSQDIILTANGTPTTVNTNNFSLNTTPGCSFTRIVNSPTTGGTAVVSAYNCATGSAGTMNINVAVSGVTQTLTATVVTVGTYNITATANGVTFTGSGTFSGTGAQNIVLTASGTPNAAGTPSFTLNTTPGCSFSRTITNNPYVTGLSCVGATLNNRYLSSGFSSNGTTITVPYTGGNGIAYTSQTVSSTGITGITATLAAGTLANGSGNLIYTLNGTPSGAGTANFAFSMGGQSCTFSTTVYNGKIDSITNASEPAENYYIKPSSVNYWFYTPGLTGPDNSITLKNTKGDVKQYWNFINMGIGQYALYIPNTGYVVDNYNGGTGNGTTLIAYPSNVNTTGNSNQRYIVSPISGSMYNGGTFSIRTAMSSGQAFDVTSCNWASGYVQLYGYAGNGCQIFSLEKVHTLTSGVTVPANYWVSFGYFGGNGGTHPAVSVASTGVTGLTATLAANSFYSSSVTGYLRFTISGTPSGSGNANFQVFIGGQSYSFSLAVQ